VQAARLVDLKNLFTARVIGHDDARTLLDWNGRQIEALRAESRQPGAIVAWAIPGSQVLLSRTDLNEVDTTPNRFAGAIQDLIQLSESLSVTVVLDGADAPVLSMTLPAHYARRTGLGPGSRATIALMPDGIHVMDSDVRSDGGRETGR
jgi:molybdate transport system ATP-binding protein